MPAKIVQPVRDKSETLDALLRDIRACRVCLEKPQYGNPLPHEPRPVVQISKTARICIASQAPGTRVHRSGRPFDDPSGVRLRGWLGIDETTFYDPSRVAIIPMGFCFPGLRADGSDLPPRRECAELWRTKLFARLPGLRLLLVIGAYAQRWHLGASVGRQGVNDTVAQWRNFYCAAPALPIIPLPHPSWHNNRWLNSNPWFETELLPVLRTDVRQLLF